jgi:chemotaxis protein methyltransferase CheR
MLSDRQFNRAKRLALSLAGIELVERHRELLARRSRRLGIPDSAGLVGLFDAVEAGEAVAKKKFLCLLTTKFTGFFRHPRQFDIAAQHAFRAAEHRGQARLWCAAAATGEEPYSLAMALIEASQRDDPPASILATDLDVDALAVAQRGEYGAVALRGFPPARRERFLHPAEGPRRWVVVPTVRRLVQFRPLNLISEIWTVEGEFDVILCRNVLMYLEACYRYAVLERIATLLAPGGLLMLDPAEHLGKAGHLFTPEAEAVYRRRGTASPRRNAIEL